MPRQELIQSSNRHCATCVIEVTDIFTHKQVTDDGRLIRSDGRDLWSVDGRIFYGCAPDGWDVEKAERAAYLVTYTVEQDYS